MLLSPAFSGPEEQSRNRRSRKRKELGCDNIFDWIPTLTKENQLGITSQCKDHFNEKHRPWQKQDKGCSMQLIDYMKNTNVKMKEAVCRMQTKTEKRGICSTPFLSKMCLGNWNSDKETAVQECKGANEM